MAKLGFMLAAFLAVGPAPATRLWAASPGPLQYNRDVRSILSDNCFACHGPDEDKRAAGLRLDQREAATTELVAGVRPIVPGRAGESELIARIKTHDKQLQMPPADSGKELTAEEIAILERWINEGAEYQAHWSFVAPPRPPVPEVHADAVVANPIDAFIVDALEELGCGQAPEADRRTQLRRLSLDITGLPPTPDEVEAFSQDADPNAYEHAVDRLLASPRHGEHMARYWLDAARYGDTHGLHLDNYREMWPYRDWVIRAFSQNLPWDQFVIKQLAGDLLPDPTLDDQIATGFNRCHVSTSEGGSIDEEVEVRNVVDRVSTTGAVFLGLTMGCAVCHDHKYDPISQQDFYSSYAFFNSIDGPAMDQNTRDTAPSVFAPTAAQAGRIAALEQRRAELTRRLIAADPVLEQEQLDWTQAERRGASDRPAVRASSWSVVGPFFGPMRYLNSQNFGPEGAQVDLSGGYDAGRPEKLTWRRRLDWIDGQTHEDIPGAIAASYLCRTLVCDSDASVVAKVRVRGGWAAYLNNQMVHDQRRDNLSLSGPDVELKLSLKKGENQLLVKLITPPGAPGVRETSAFCFAWAPDAGVDSLPIEARSALAADDAQRTAEQQELLRRYYRFAVCQDVGVRKTVDEIQRVELELAKTRTEVATTLVMRERADPKPAFLLVRGLYNAPDKELGPLKRVTPSFLPPLPEDAPADRLGYAKWLVSPENPLHARVTVNRLWQQFFGEGLVETADDFGMQGAWPSHPELLDWLAVEFRESGWDVRHMIRLITHSHTYRQSSLARPEVAIADPQNRLLARGPRRRLDAEVVRDQALAISGQLVHKLGGPSVKPPQPAGLWKAVAYSGSNTNLFTADVSAQDVHRRSVYTFWKRTAPPPQMTLLDAPSRESCTVRRERTNTPLQALLLLNEEQFVDAARSLALRSLEESADADPRTIATRMFRLATLREPSDGELSTLCRLYQQTHERYLTDPAAAGELASTAGGPPVAPHQAPRLAAWTLVANTVLNLDEVLVNE